MQSAIPMTAKKYRRRGVVLSLTGQRKLEATRRQLERDLNCGDRFTLEELRERTQLAISTIARILEAQIGVDKITLSQFFSAFDLTLERTDYQQPDDQSEEIIEPDLVAFDRGEGVNIANFHGRADELIALTDWIVTDKCCLVSILGLGGIGKTALSVKLAERLIAETAGEFKRVIWRSLRNAPPLATLLDDLVPFLSSQQDTQNTLPRLIHHLQHDRCLVILDNLETLMQGGTRAGQFRVDYEDYGELLRLVAESQHQSCIILTSREKPAEVAAYEGEQLQVRSFCLGGSVAATQAILQAKGAIGTTEQQRAFGDRYGNIPLAVKIAATSVRDLFAGDLGRFLQEETFVFNGVRQLLDRQFGGGVARQEHRLTELEQSIMYWLAINREWMTVAELDEDILPTVSKGKLLEALESLTWRSAIESESGRYTLQPVVMEYMTDRAIEQIVGELQTLKLDFWLHYALVKTTVKDYVRSSQIRLFLGAIATELLGSFGSIESLSQQIVRVLAELRSDKQDSGYATGNLINFCTYLLIDLTDWDFSQLTIRHACLEDVRLQRTNFANANFIHSHFLQPFGSAFSVAFSPDGTQLATGDTSGSACLWRVADGQPLAVFKGHNNWVRSFQFSPRAEANLLASASHDRTLKIWHTTGECLHTLEGHEEVVWAMSWRSDGQMLASGGFDRQIRLWDVETGECLNILSGHASMIFAVAWHPDLRTLASGSSDCTIKIWDVETGKCLQTIQQDAMVLSLAWSPDGEILASGNGDNTVKLWQAIAGTCLATLPGHTSWVWSIVWSPNGQMLASGSQDHTVRIWDAIAGICIKTLQGHTAWIGSVAWSPDGRTIASCSDDRTIRLWDLTGQCLRTLHGYAAQVFAIAWNPQLNIIASGTQDSTIRLWDVSSGACDQTLIGHTSGVWAIAWSPDGEMLASGSSDNTVKLWDVQGKCWQTLVGHFAWIWAVAWSPTGDRLASCSGDATLKIWDVSTGECLNTLQGHTDTVWSVAWSPDGQILATSSSDCTVRLWDAQTGAALATWTGHTNWIFSVAWSPDGLMLASCGSDTTVRVWQLPLRLADPPSCQVLVGTDALGAMAWHPNGKILATGGSDRTVVLWEPQTGTQLKTLSGHTSWVRSIVWIEDGAMLASGSADETIALWDVEMGECVKIMRLDRPYEGTNISGVSGLTTGSISTLKSLGAVEV